MKRQGIFPRELLISSAWVLAAAVPTFLMFALTFNEYSSLHYMALVFAVAVCVGVRGQAAQSGWAMTQLASPRTVRERVRAVYLHTIVIDLSAWALCFAVTLLKWKFGNGVEYSTLATLGFDDPSKLIPVFYPLCYLVLTLVLIAASALHLGENSWARSRVGQAVFSAVLSMPAALLITYLTLFALIRSGNALWNRDFLAKVWRSFLFLLCAGVLLIAASWCVSLLSEYRRLALRRPPWIKVAAILCAVLSLEAAIAGGYGTARMARAEIAQAEKLREERLSEEQTDKLDTADYTYTSTDDTAREILSLSVQFAEESFIGKTRKEFDRRIEELKLEQTDDDAERTYSDGQRHVNHVYRTPESGATVYLPTQIDEKLGTVTQFTAHFEHGLVADAMTYEEYRKILTDTKPGDRETAFLHQQAMNGIYPEMIRQQISKFDGVEEHVYDFNVSITSFLGTVNKDNVAEAAAWLRITVTARDGFVTDVLPMLTTSHAWETNFAKEHEAERHAAQTDFRRLAAQLEAPVIGGSLQDCQQMLQDVGFTTQNDLDWKTESGDPAVQISSAADRQTVRTFQYGAPNAVRIDSHMSAAQVEALQHCAPAGSDAEALHKALLKNELLPRAILEYADQSGTVYREYLCDLLLTQYYDTTTQRSVTFTFRLENGVLVSTSADFIPTPDNVS